MTNAFRASIRTGLLYGIGAYAWWGLVAHYFKAVSHVPATIVLCHRVVWSVILLAALLAARHQWGQVLAALRAPRTLAWLGASTLLIATNWLVFIYSIEKGRLVEASLGYFINPLFTVMLGLVFLHEKLRPAQWAAILIAASGIIFLAASRGGLPWISIVLPISFGLYSLIRKRLPVPPVTGLFLETCFLAPLAVAYLSWWHLRPDAPPPQDTRTLALLMLGGVVTAVPLLWVVNAAKRLPLTTLGFLQYISPMLQLLTAVAFFGEPFGRDRVIAFSLIWLAVGVYTLDAIRANRRRRLAEPAFT